MRYLAVLVAVLGSLVPCQAQNLLPNPQFNQDVSGWSLPPSHPSSLVWDSQHSATGPGGSALLTNPSGLGFGAALSTMACVPVTPGVRYSFGGRYLFPAGKSRTSITLGLVFTSDPGCANPLISSASNAGFPNPVTDGQWLSLDGGGGIVAPANARAALFSVNVGSPFDEPPMVYFDDLFLVDPALTDVPALSPSGLLALALGLGGAAVWVLWRRRAAA